MFLTPRVSGPTLATARARRGRRHARRGGLRANNLDSTAAPALPAGKRREAWRSALEVDVARPSARVTRLPVARGGRGARPGADGAVGTSVGLEPAVHLRLL